MSEATTLNELHAILTQVMAKVERAYDEARADGVKEPTILVLDVRDEHAKAIAEQFMDAALVEPLVVEAGRRGKRPNLIIPLPRHQASTLVSTYSWQLGSELAASNAQEGYLAVVIALGTGIVVEIRPHPVGMIGRTNPFHRQN